METVVNRKNDIQDILDKVTTGWIPPPNQPAFIIEDNANPRWAFINNVAADGVFLVLKNMKREYERRSPIYQNRVYTFPCYIIAGTHATLSGEDLTEDILDQSREVFDRYSSAPWSTSALGTSTTYNLALIEESLEQFDDDIPLPKYVLAVDVQLAELDVAIVIA